MEYCWYYVLYHRQPGFRQKITQIYEERYRPALKILVGQQDEPTTGPLHSLDFYKEEMDASAKMNFIRWPASSIKGYHLKMGSNFEKANAELKVFLERKQTCAVK